MKLATHRPEPVDGIGSGGGRKRGEVGAHDRDSIRPPALLATNLSQCPLKRGAAADAATALATRTRGRTGWIGSTTFASSIVDQI